MASTQQRLSVGGGLPELMMEEEDDPGRRAPAVRRAPVPRLDHFMPGPSKPSQQNLREYLGMPFKPPDPPPPLELYPRRRQTAELAMRRITDSCFPPGSARAGPSSTVTVRDSNPPRSFRHTTAGPSYELPLVLHRLLEARLFRLAVFHTLKTPEYAVDPVLVHRLADRLEHQGAGKLATRLRRGWDNDSRLVNMETAGGAQEGSSKPKLRLWTDPDPHRGRRPPDHWRHMTTLSAASSSAARSALPNHLTPQERDRAITRFHNAALSAWLKGSSTKDPALTRGVIPMIKMRAPEGWVAPGRGMGQLRALLDKIASFEKNRGFKPDRVTGCIIIRCWLACLGNGRQTDYQPGPDPRRSTDHTATANTASELRRIFDMVSRYYTVMPVTAEGPPNAVVTGSSSTPLGRDDFAQSAITDNVDYRRHVRPFATMMTRAFRDLGDMAGVKRVMQWWEEQKVADEGRDQAHWRGTVVPRDQTERSKGSRP